MDGITRLTTRRRLDSHRHILRAQDVFIEPAGARHARWRNTLTSAVRYADGLLTPGRRKSMRSISSRVNLPKDRVEQFIRNSPWDANKVHDHLRDTLPDHLRTQDAALVLDEVGVPKQGKHSVGVYRQYCGETGKVDNCQVAVNLVITRPGEARNADHVTWPLGMRLYVPDAWLTDPDYQGLRRDAGIPADHEFRTKPQLSWDLLEPVLDAGVEHCVILGDAGYGDNSDLRALLRDRDEAYILGTTPSRYACIPADARVEAPGPKGAMGRPAEHDRYGEDVVARSPKELAATVTEWPEVVWGEKPSGEPLVARVVAFRVRLTKGAKERRRVTDESVTLLLERRPHELKAWLCWGVDDWPLDKLVAYAHLRWVIEQFHRDTKQALGFGDFEGRTLRGWYHHVAMVLLAHAFVATLRLERVCPEGLPPFEEVVRELQIESGVQLLMDEHDMGRAAAEPLARSMHRHWMGSA